MRILAVDWGTVRVGLAISDENQKIAFPIDQAIETKKAIEEIKQITKEYQLAKILIGMPKSLTGTQGGSAEKVKRFIVKLEHEIDVPIEPIDERFSSVFASKALSAQGLSAKDQRGQVDTVAAQMLLQTYLDNKK